MERSPPGKRVKGNHIAQNWKYIYQIHWPEKTEQTTMISKLAQQDKIFFSQKASNSYTWIAIKWKKESMKNILFTYTNNMVCYKGLKFCYDHIRLFKDEKRNNIQPLAIVYPFAILCFKDCTYYIKKL